MKKFIKKKLKSLLSFVELFLRIKVDNKSPVDVYYDNLSQDCYKFFEQDMKKSSIFIKVEDIRKFAIHRAFNNGNKKDNFFLEFGVWKGESINLFGDFLAQHNNEIHGFDSFEGLTEDWLTHVYNPIGALSLNKKRPKVLKNVKLVTGKVQETLENFLKNKKDKKIIFAHMDMDTYASTKYALNCIKPFLQKGSVILFDEFYGYPNWQHQEYKAFKEVFSEKEYKYIAFCASEVAIEIL